MNYYVYALLFIVLPEWALAQTGTLIAGPFAGSVTTTSAKVWLSYHGAAGSVTLTDTTEKNISQSVSCEKIGNLSGDTSAIYSFTGLRPGHCYRVGYTLNAVKNTPECRFNTQTDAKAKDVDFLLGSCALLTTGFWRMIFPGADIRIYRHMIKTPTDFMVWLGDNVYYLGKDYKTYNNMFNRTLEVRSKFWLMNHFLATQPNYAIWDDHDYGWNDADRSFPGKDSALKVFRGFWPNTYEKDVKENYFTFRYSDAEFFMTDGRWYRAAPGDTAGDFLGAKQLAWLEEKLSQSDATFKFICTGSQVINDNQHGESYAHYPVERNKLLDYIAGHNIKGVIFLTGDKHYTELSKRDWQGYTVYDFTSSPISSPVISRKMLRAFDNPYSIRKTVVYRKNFGRIKLSGDAGNRKCTLLTYGKDGKLKWTYEISASELSKK
jgi:alkaline phosphatase D